MFKEGQRVYCLIRGWGKVVFTSPGRTVDVSFDKTSNTFGYDDEGRPHAGALRTLYFDQPIITGGDTPPFEPILESGKRYLVHQVVHDLWGIAKVIEEDEHVVTVIFESCLGEVPVYSAVISGMKNANWYKVMKDSHDFYPITVGLPIC